MEVPEKMQGLIFRENEKLQAEESERVLKFAGKFDKFTYWNYDKNPTDNDAYKKSLHFMKVAEAVSQNSCNTIFEH
jgi:ribonuclease H2 subunit C